MEKIIRRYLQDYEKETDLGKKLTLTFDTIKDDLFLRERLTSFLLSTYDSVYTTIPEYEALLLISDGMDDPNRLELLSDYNKMKLDAKK